MGRISKEIWFGKYLSYRLNQSSYSYKVTEQLVSQDLYQCSSLMGSTYDVHTSPIRIT